MPKKLKIKCITGRHNSGRTLQESEKRLAEFINLANEQFAIFDSKLNCVVINKAALKMMSLREKDVIGKNFRDIFPDAHKRNIYNKCIKVIKTGKPLSIENFVPHPKMGEMYLTIEAFKVGDGLGITIRNITKQKKVEQALQENEKQKFGDVVENAREWIWEVDTNGKYTYSSQIVKKILGYNPEKVLKMHFYDFFAPKDKKKMKKLAFEVFAKKESFRDFINLNIHKDGKEVWLSTSGVPILDAKGNLLGYRGADADITELKKANIKLQKKNDELKRFHNLVVGRELKMMELKKRIKKLEEKRNK